MQRALDEEQYGREIMTHNPEGMVDPVGQQMQFDVDRRDLVINRTGQKGPTARMCT